jgi:hypothetical protein
MQAKFVVRQPHVVVVKVPRETFAARAPCRGRRPSPAVLKSFRGAASPLGVTKAGQRESLAASRQKPE